MKLLFWLAVVLVTMALALFAVANRESVTLGLWPLPFILELPLYLAVILAVLIGFLTGAAVAWMAGHHWRRETRRRGRRIAALERELIATQAQLSGPRETPTAPLAVRG